MRIDELTEKEIERRRKISKTLTGFKRPPFSEEHRNKIRISRVGRRLSEGARLKLSRAFKGRISPMKGRKHTEETRNKMRGRKAWNKGLMGTPQPKGELSPQWRGGLTPIHRRIRNSTEYKLWRRAVLERDENSCVWCKSIINVEVDHIKPFSLYPELRFAIDNGRVLCRECHFTTDTYGGKIHKNKQKN